MKYKKYSVRDSVKNYFPLPNEIYALGLNAGEIAVYGYLMFCEDRTTFRCHPSFRTIGKAVKMSNNTVRKYVNSLENKCLIQTEPTKIISKNGKKQNGSLQYTIRPIEEAVRYYIEHKAVPKI